MFRWLVQCFVLSCVLAISPVMGQVVETEPAPPRTDQSVTLFFNADEGTGGLEGHDGQVFAHTGLSTDENPPEAWKCVKNHWPTDPNFMGNRDDTELTQVGDNRWRLQIDDIRAYYQNTSTSCDLAEGEKIETMNMVFRNADGSKEGKGEGGSDIFVEVNDVSGADPFLSVNLTNPDADPPLFPFMTASDTTVTVSLSADTARVDGFSELRLSVDGSQVASTTETSLSHDLTLDTPNRFKIQGIAEATAGSETLRDTVETFLIRTPNVVDEPRPSGVQDGVNVESESRVILSMFAPKKDFVYAIGDFSDWEIDDQFFMKRHQVTPDSVHWWVEVDGLSSTQQYDYQFFVDGEIRMSDPFSEKVRSPDDQFLNQEYTVFPGLEPYPENQTEGMVSVFDTEPDDFNFSAFDRPAPENLVVYELLIRDFREQHSFQAVIDSLSYLDSLGVNAIELMPVSNFDGNISWGYNPNHHHAVDKSYGPAEDLKRLVEEAHQRGIAVILDVVYNHATDRSPFVQLYGTSDDNPFLNVPPSTPFSVFNQLNHGNGYIKTWMDRANERWLTEFNIDGFRFDLTKGFISGQPTDPNGFQQRRIDNLKRMADAIWGVDSDAYVILEHFGVNEEERALANHRADETGGMMLWHNMNRAYSQADMGFLSAEDFSSDLSASYYPNRGMNQPNLVTYMESHDEQWLMRRKKQFGNSSDEQDTQEFGAALNRQKLVGAFFFTVPGPRMMWQFGEVGYGWGPDECLKPGGEGDGECASGDPGRTAPKPVRWQYADPEESPDRVRLFKTWEALIELRKAHPVFRSPETEVEMQVGDGDRIRWIRLSHPTMDALVVGNFSLIQREAEVSFQQTGTWHNVFENTSFELDETAQTIPLLPGEFRLFTSDEPAVTPEEGLVPSAANPAESFAVDISTTFGSVTDPSNYRLVALPGSTRVPVEETLSGTPGDTWRAFLDDGSDDDFLVEFDETDDRFAFVPGRGFWVLSDLSFGFQGTVPNVPIRGEGTAAIPVQDGWNIVSNPLARDVDWSQVQAASDLGAPLYRWAGGSFEQTDTFRSATSGEAFYVNVPADQDSLRLPFPGSIAAQTASETEPPLAVQSMQAASTLHLNARLDSTSTATVRIGETKASAPVYHEAPRAPFTDVALRARGPDGEALATHVRSAEDDETGPQSFDLRLLAPPGREVELRASDLEAWDSRSVVLVNQKTGQRHSLHEDEPVTISTTAEQTPLRVELGAAPTETVVPDAVRLHNNYPNPFRGSTTIEFELPDRRPVQLTVYDLLGRKVETLVNGERTAGRHEVTWDGGERSLSSGVYFLRLKAGDAVKTTRMTLVR